MMKPSPLTKVAVHGVPRSGTSWIGEVLNSSPHTIYCYQPIFSYAMKDFLTPASTLEDIDNFFRCLETIQDDFISQTAKRSSGSFPHFEKERPTHIVYKEVRYINVLPNLMRRSDDVHLCAVIRNPLSVISSWLRASREFRKDLGWDEIEEWRYALKKNLNKPEEFNGYEKWKESTLLFHWLKQQYPNRVHLLVYSAFLADPLGQTLQLYQSLGLPIMDSTKQFVSQSQNCSNNDPYSVFRNLQTDTKWKAELNPDIATAIISDIQGSVLEQYMHEPTGDKQSTFF